MDVDVLMADIYPIASSGQAACTVNTSAACNLQKNIGGSLRTTIQNTGKPLWFVPQAFGNQEGIQREPSVGELRAFVYTAVIAGATGMFFFAKEDNDKTPPVVHSYVHVGSAQPRSAYMWSEARRLAFELTELGPSLISNRTKPVANATIDGVEIGAWQEANDGTLVIAVNLLDIPVPAVSLNIVLDECPHAMVDTTMAQVLFGVANRSVRASVSASPAAAHISSCTVTFSDVMSEMSTRIYRLPPPSYSTQPAAILEPTEDPYASNLIFNGGFEASSSGPGTADGMWATAGGDPSATQQTDSAVVFRGRHSMRLRTPEAAH
eukprot:SAG31_NODE_7894_length_1572_cov_0.756280_2_plen_321_part_01